MRKELLKNRYFILFGVEHYNPLGVIRSLGEEGIKPIAIILKERVVLTSKSKYISKLHIVDSIEDGYEVLLKYLEKTKKKSFIYTADDKIACFLDNHFDELSGKCYFFNAGEKGRISYFINKENIMACAKRHGLNVLESVTVKRGEIPEDLQYPIITKAVDPTVGAWKNDMFICTSEKELKSAYRQIQSPDVILQKYIKKKNEYCMEGFSVNHGNDMIVTIASTYNYLQDKTYSSYMTVSNFDKKEIKEPLDKMFKEIGFEGIFEIEFLIDKKDNMYFSEINFRNSTWSYASTCAGMNLPYLWAVSMLNNEFAEKYYKYIPVPFTAIVELTDFKVRVLGRKISILQWLRELKRCKCRYYLNKKDMKPIIAMVASRMFKRK